MYYLAQILIVLILFSIQTTWLGMFSVGGVVPDLALIWVVYCAVHYSKTMGVGSGVMTGILKDSNIRHLFSPSFRKWRLRSRQRQSFSNSGPYFYIGKQCVGKVISRKAELTQFAEDS